MKKKTFIVPDMLSTHCQAVVARTINGMNGATMSSIRFGRVDVCYDPSRCDEATIASAIRKAGYTVAPD